MPLIGAVSAWAPAAQAQSADVAPVTGGRALVVTTSLSVQETLSNNVGLVSDNPRSDLITQVSPGIRISSRSRRMQGSLDYSLNALVYARESDLNTVQNSLRAALSAEAIEDHVFIDAQASISQQAISAFGTQVPQTGVANNNRSEVSTLSLSPRLRTRLGSNVEATAQVTWATTSSDSTTAGDATSVGATAGVGGRLGRFGWNLNASRDVSDFDAGREATSDAAGATLSFFPDPELQLSLRAGWEANNVQSLDRESSESWGWGANWRPTDRTDIALQSDRRYFGRSHTLSLRHRMARSVWSYTDTRGVTGAPTGQGGLRPLTLFDLFYANCLRGGGAAATCEQSVREDVAGAGAEPNAVIGGFLSNALSLQRSQTLSVAYSGLRTTLTLAGFRTRTERLDRLSPASDDLSLVDSVRQLGYTLGVAHRLTPIASLSVTGTHLKTMDAGTVSGTEQRSLLVNLSTSLGRRTSGSIGLRHTRFDSQADPYEETALIGSLSIRF